MMHFIVYVALLTPPSPLLDVLCKRCFFCHCSPITAVSNGPSGIAPNSTSVIHDNHASADGGFDQSNTTASMSKSEGPLLLSSHVDSVKNPNGPETKDIHQHQMLEISNSAASVPSAPAPGSYFSSSDPILLPSQESPLPSIRREVGSQRAPVELIDDNSNENKSTSAKICMLIVYLLVYIFFSFSNYLFLYSVPPQTANGIYLLNLQ